MGLKSTIIAGFMIAGMSLSSLAMAYSDLKIQNDTNRDSTSVINKGACSTILGNSGVTKKHTVNTVSGLKLAFACGVHPSDCKADVYMTNNCKGPIVATAEIDLNNGVKYVTATAAGRDYTFGWEKFTVIMGGGPA